MNTIYKTFSPGCVESITKGGIGIIPTDTIYGITASALNEDAVTRLYSIRKRPENKPMIILIDSYKRVADFCVQKNILRDAILHALWPNQISIVLPCHNATYSYLHRGTNTLAFRVPNNIALRNFLEKTGPLVAPSANVAGERPALTVEDAYAYFGNKVDFYVDQGTLKENPSTVIALDADELHILREGAVPEESLKRMLRDFQGMRVTKKTS